VVARKRSVAQRRLISVLPGRLAATVIVLATIFAMALRPWTDNAGIGTAPQAHDFSGREMSR
jgi:hypothetical protein